MSTLVRPRFGPGMLLQHDDLEQLGTYTRELNRLLFRSLFGCGVVCGLEVTTEENCGKVCITVGAGPRAHCDGDPIYVPKEQTVAIDEDCEPIEDELWVVLCGTSKCCAPRTASCPHRRRRDRRRSARASATGSRSAVVREKPEVRLRLRRRGVSTRPRMDEGTARCACCIESPVPESCYEDHYDGKCGCDCDDCDGSCGDCILLARLTRDGETVERRSLACGASCARADARSAQRPEADGSRPRSRARRRDDAEWDRDQRSPEKSPKPTRRARRRKPVEQMIDRTPVSGRIGSARHAGGRAAAAAPPRRCRSGAPRRPPSPVRALQERLGQSGHAGADRAIDRVAGAEIGARVARHLAVAAGRSSCRRPSRLPAKVSKPTDPAELEAEETARKVMRMREPPARQPRRRSRHAARRRGTAQRARGRQPRPPRAAPPRARHA